MMHTLFFRFFAVLTILFIGCTGLGAQDMNLANQYFANGEYEKAATLFGQLLETNAGNEFVVNRYVECMINLEKYEEGEKIIKKLIKKTPGSGNLYVQYGNLQERQGKLAEANEQFDKAIEVVSPDYNSIYRLASQFTYANKFDLALRTYERGATLLKDKTIFSMNLGELYRRKGDSEKMIENYLNSLINNDGSRLGMVQISLARFLSPEEFGILQSQLYTRIQADESPDFIELLAWSFIQTKDYKNALRQLKALDQRLGENGIRVFKLARDAAEDKDYDSAISAYQYITQEKGAQNPYFFLAKQGLTKARRDKITTGYSYSAEDLRLLEAEYQSFLDQYGMNRQTSTLVLEMAELEALYVNDLSKAIGLLDTLIRVPGLERDDRSRAKINLADYYLMTGERWESTLLYSQVDKDNKEEVVGQEARFKNAKLAYYNGDFQWAQAQFDVLKASTSKLIANDALDLSVFIMDNLNLDTTSDAITLYAGAELLVFQNRFEEAIARLDTLRREFPEHSLQDDIFYLEAQIAQKRNDFVKAAALYQKVADTYPEDIRADNALYALAQLYETRLDAKDKAQTLYEKIFTDYSGSVFAVDARKRYRLLRGDKVQ
jgi:tetratricopeptide (TPR) repeat protein